MKNFSERIAIVRKTHSSQEYLSLKEPSYQKEVLKYTSDSFEVDLGEHGDITTQLFSDKSLSDAEKSIVSAKIISKSSGILAGVYEAQFFLSFHQRILVSTLRNDGDIVKSGDVLFFLEGPLVDLLEIERTLLNLLQRMSGVATFTAQFVKAAGDRVLVTPTRKTLWGLLDKRACAVGGGGTHRLNLSDAVLIKDTHLDMVHRDFDKVFQVFQSQNELGRFVEIEVENAEEAFEVARLYCHHKSFFKVPFFIMFDNMKPEEISQCVLEIFKKFPDLLEENGIFFEASGGIRLENIRQFADTGVDVVSVGVLTHSAPAMDISLKIA